MPSDWRAYAARLSETIGRYGYVGPPILALVGIGHNAFLRKLL